MITYLVTGNGNAHIVWQGVTVHLQQATSWLGRYILGVLS